MKNRLTFRRLALVGALAVGALTLAACNNGAGGGDASPAVATANGPGGGAGAGKKLGSTIPTFNHPFFVAMKKGLEEEAQARGCTINVVDGKNDAQAQISAIDTFCVQKVDAIILCPTETETLPPGVEKANSAGIPVITVNRTVAGGNTVTYVGADDTEGGRMQGRALMDALPDGARIVLLQGIIGSSPQRNREAGLEEVLTGNPKYQIVQKSPYDFDKTKGVSVMETVLLKFKKGEIDAVVAQSDDGALAAADVCARTGRTELKIIGFNGESDAFDYIREGKIHATILQDAETQGREAVKTTLKHLAGETVEKEIITPLHIVDKTSIDQYKPAWQSSRS
jgi:ribose transport system substrate-binding protein